MNLHDDRLELGDRVYDVSIGRGFGEVIQINDNNSYFQVRFASYSVNYTSNGIQQGKSEQTLYWGRPLIIKPRKDEQQWAKKSELVGKFFNLVRDYSEFV